MKKETIKTLVIGILAGIIIAGGTGTVIAYNINSNNVNYNPSDSAWKVNSVSDAIDDLYIKKTGDNYSTKERVVGTWTNGKPVYQKVFNVSVAKQQTTPVASLIDPIDELIDYRIFTINGTEQSPRPDSDTQAWVNGKNIYVYLGATFNNVRIIIQYTKTTDQVPVSEQEG